MRSVLLSAAFGKRPLSNAAQAFPASAPAFEQVFTASLQNAQPVLLPLDRSGGRPVERYAAEFRGAHVT